MKSNLGKYIVVPFAIYIIILFLIAIIGTSYPTALAEPGDATKDIINLNAHVVTEIKGLYDMDIEINGYTIDQNQIIIPYYGHINVNGSQVTINDQKGDATLLSEYLLTTTTERHILGINGNIKDIYAYVQTTQRIDTNDTFYTFENAKTGNGIQVEKTVLVFESINGVGVSYKQTINGKGITIGEKNYNITNTMGFWVTERNTVYDNYYTKKTLIYDYDGESLYLETYNEAMNYAKNNVNDQSESYKVGYKKGYNDGYSNSENIHFVDVIKAVFDVPAQWLTNMLDYEILGFNLKTFFQSIVTITIIIAIIKIII